MRRRFAPLAVTLALLATAALVTLGPAVSGARAAAPRSPPPEPDAHTALLAAIPILKTTHAHEALGAWERVKAASGVKAQLEQVAKQALTSTVCDDLVDFRDLVTHSVLGSGLGFRDNIRGRSWGRASLALVLRDAWQRFRQEYPDKELAIGDVSQPGCGQVSHGVLIQTMSGVPAAALMTAASLVEATPMVVDIRRGSDFPYEADRFTAAAQRVRVETRIFGRSKDGTTPDAYTLRTGRARYVETEAPTDDETLAFEREVASLARGGQLVAQQRVTGPDEVAGWRSYWVAPGAKRQMIAWTPARPSRRFSAAEATVIRIAGWQDKKPGSLPNEVRWERQSLRPTPPKPPGKPVRGPKPPPVPEATWHRWAAMYEAGHITHLAGIDADLSYVMRDNKGHFAVDLENIDVPATFRWFELVDETARKLGTPIEAILVDPKVKTFLRAKLPMKGKESKARSRVWNFVRLVGGHDGHHHLRITEPSAAKEKAARKALGLD